MASGARSKFGFPIFEPDAFRNQMFCIEEGIYGIAGTCLLPQSFGAPRSDSVPGNSILLAPHPRYVPVFSLLHQ